MKPLFLDPLPSTRDENGTDPYFIADQDFVEEAAVRAVMLGQTSLSRRQSNFNDLALAAGDLDFAGWQMPEQAPKHLPPASTQPPRHQAPQMSFRSQPESTVPTRRHRWWFPGIGAFLTIGLGTWLWVESSVNPDQSFQAVVENLFQLPFGLAGSD